MAHGSGLRTQGSHPCGLGPSRLVAVAFAALLASACTAGPASAPVLAFNVPPERPSAAFVTLDGLGPADVSALEAAKLSPDQWARLLRVSVKTAGRAGGDQPAVAGTYAIDRGMIRFTPRYPFDPGRQYDVRFDPLAAASLPGLDGFRALAPLDNVVGLPGDAPSPPTTVTAIYPSGEVLPENLLRMYVHFSAPMGPAGGIEHVSVEDDAGGPVSDPFLPVDGNFWNGDRTRFTVFFDPGRVKRDILPNRRMGRPLKAGHRYTLVVDRQWEDGKGRPLAETYRHGFQVGPVDLTPLDPARWELVKPAPATREPLVVRFPKPLDRALALRALGVARGSAAMAGETALDDGERRWTFTPRDAWQPGEHALVVLTILEDASGNRIGHAFEVEGLTKDSTAQPDEVRVPFRVGDR